MFRKITLLFFAVMLTLLSVSCADSDSKTETGGGNSGKIDKNAGSMYLPEEFASKKVSASYSGRYSFDQPYFGLQYQDYGVCSLYLFEDGSWVNSVCGDFSWLGSGSVRQPCWKGTWKKEKGSFSTGKIILTHTHTWCSKDNVWNNDSGTYTLEIAEGKFEMSGFQFTRQD